MMKRTVRIHTEIYDLIRPRDVGRAPALELRGPMAMEAFLRRCAADETNLVALRGLLSELDNSMLLGPLGAEVVVEKLLWLMERGRFVVVTRPCEGPGSLPQDYEDEPEQRPQESEVAETKTWVEIQMVGADDRPISGERYEVVLPGGERKTGTTDAAGKARFSGIDPGSCTVSFPDLDEDAWNAA